ncbi:MAG: SufD family Fe-S cluster assembly protein [Spirochaetales bacterium]|nr:SufD family Fe-S cluster assembly protein [Spirochaetales bacterium]
MSIVKDTIEEQEKSEKLKEVRLRYLDLVRELPFPNRNDEDWKNTNLNNYLDIETALTQEYNFPHGAFNSLKGPAGMAVQGPAGRCCIYSMEDAAELGFLDKFTSLKGAIESVRYSPDALVRALFERGVYIKVLKDKNCGENREQRYGSKNTKKENMINVNFDKFKKTSGKGYAFYWVVVDIEGGADVILTDSTQNEVNIFGEIDIIAGNGSTVKYVSIDDTSSGGFHRKKALISAGKKSRISTYTAVTGTGDFRGELELIIQGPGVRAELKKAYTGEGMARKDFVTLQHHASGEAFSSLSVLGVLGDSSSGSFTGTIAVDHNAKGTDAYQLSRTLLLSGASRARAVPRLEILADDVKCSHGASLGRIDKDDMFYLMSRGVSEKDAEIMAAEGFFGRFIDALPDSDSARFVEERLSTSLKRICR